MSARIVPTAVIDVVESYVHSELDDAQRYENRQPLDESGVWSLHRLAAEIYELGWGDGERAESRRNDGARQRERQLAALTTKEAE